ncbi:MAG TPA: hypothetical protein VFZ04_02805 [Longimicrobiales bacterium]
MSSRRDFESVERGKLSHRAYHSGLTPRAVIDALRTRGVHHLDMPFTPSKVRHALHRAAK